MQTNLEQRLEQVAQALARDFSPSAASLSELRNWAGLWPALNWSVHQERKVLILLWDKSVEQELLAFHCFYS